MLSSGALSSAISKRIVVKIGGKVSYCIHQKMNEIIRSVRLHFIGVVIGVVLLFFGCSRTVDVLEAN